VALPPKTFDALLILIRHRQAILKKEDLIELLWPDTFVEEINLNVHISRLRKALGEDPDHKYILTIPRRGYRFVAAVEEVYQQNEALPSPTSRETSGKPAGGTRPELRLAISDGPSSGAGGEARRRWRALLSRGRAGSSRRKWATILVTFIAALVLASTYLRVGRSRGDRAQEECRKIAVLPFRFMGAAEDEYLAFGIADGLATKLGTLHALTIKRVSFLASRAGQPSDPLALGRELGVDGVLDGSLEQSPSGLRVTVRLLRVRDEKSLWVGSFDLKPLNVVDVQDSICRQLAGLLDLVRDGAAGQRVARNDTRNSAAYEAYLRGLYFWNKRTNEGLKKAIEYFMTAIAEDAGYAPAYAALADCYHLRAHYNFMTFAQAYPLEKANATRALELDETLAQAHMVMGAVLAAYEGDSEGGSRELRRAIELDPNYPTAHQRYGWMLVDEGNLEEALLEMRRAVDLDPLSVINNTALALLLYFDGQYDASLELCRKALEFDPTSFTTVQVLGMVHLEQGLLDTALPELEQVERDDPESVESLGTLGNAYARAGKMAMAGKCLAKLERMSRGWDNPLFGIALIYAGMDDQERTFAWLNRAAQSDGLPEYYARFDRRLAALRSDPRFEGIIRAIYRPRAKIPNFP
jgi:DNA-binding winged helix-turn-helix (wHTH) protein/tetratricopeptide (TPR) repeat protein